MLQNLKPLVVYKILFFILINLSSFTAQASSTTSTANSNSYEHQNYGCPLNSTCTKKLGEIRQKVINYLEKSNFSKLANLVEQKGFFIKTLASTDYTNTESILWDSPCLDAKTKNYFQFSFELVKNTKSLAKKKELITSKLYLFSQKKPIEYIIPYGSRPIYRDNTSVYFAESIESEYFYLKVSLDGSIKVLKKIDAKAKSKKADVISCPNNLNEFKKKLLQQDSPLSQFYCLNLWNNDLKGYEIALVPFNCS